MEQHYEKTLNRVNFLTASLYFWLIKSAIQMPIPGAFWMQSYAGWGGEMGEGAQDCIHEAKGIAKRGFENNAP